MRISDWSSDVFSSGLLTAPSVQAQQSAADWSPPPESERCPSKWGAGDERGSANHMTPESVLKATSLIKTGEGIELGHAPSASMPFFGTRSEEQTSELQSLTRNSYAVFCLHKN